jgi:3-phosphoshikimate 1-carboxyvinyltransferase
MSNLMTTPASPGSPPETAQISGGRGLVGALRVPGDKSISHRALLLGALAEGTSVITGLSDGDDVRRMLDGIRALGAVVDEVAGTVTVQGGRSRLRPPGGAIDLGNSGTAMRLLAGVVATLDGTTVLTGDRSLCSRPMDRVAEPLGRMGATVVGQGQRCLPPIEVTGGHLCGIEYTPPMASAQVKSAVLLAGLDAEGETLVHEPTATRTHTEEMLELAGADIQVARTGGGWDIRVRRSRLSPRDTSVPGDPSQAAFWVVGGIVVPNSQVTVNDVHLGTERIGFLRVLLRMGAMIDLERDGRGGGAVTVRAGRLRGTVVRAEEIPSLDEVPILAVAGAVAEGQTRFTGVGELRVKESDRLAGTVDLVTAFGGSARVEGEDLVVDGMGGALRPGWVDAHGDHRMAMAAAIAGASCPRVMDVTTIAGWESVATSYPGFADQLHRLSGVG